MIETEQQEHYRVRLGKLEELERAGVEAFPVHSEKTHTAAEALATFPSDAEVVVAGRIVTQIKRFGKLAFCHLQDLSGRIQLAFKLDALGDERFKMLELIDTGDLVEAKGPLFQTRTGETTVEVRDYRLLAKALRPLPEKWHGLTDTEKRYRQRYLDLITNEDARRTFVVRSKVVAAIRRFLDGRGFLEVETPVLQPVYGGAAARPFVTHHNALDRKLYLRVAFELYLKRLIVGGIDKVYEIGRDFRNEGIDRLHNPEFTMLETYEAYADYRDVMVMVEEMISGVAQEVLGSTVISFRGNEVDLKPPWRRLPLLQSLEEIGIDTSDPIEAARAKGLPVAADWTRGKAFDELISNFVEPRLIQPTFLVDYPVEFPGSLLAKRKPDSPGLVERFEGYVGGFEVCNAFSELNDPRDQRARFLEQVPEDADSNPIDEDYLLALEHGMPPAGGLGIGIDRLMMLLTDNATIREVILFPQLRTIEAAE
jgi:lysyl-tRNA synthetase, class II